MIVQHDQQAHGKVIQHNSDWNLKQETRTSPSRWRFVSPVLNITENNYCITARFYCIPAFFQGLLQLVPAKKKKQSKEGQIYGQDITCLSTDLFGHFGRFVRLTRCCKNELVSTLSTLMCSLSVLVGESHVKLYLISCYIVLYCL